MGQHSTGVLKQRHDSSTDYQESWAALQWSKVLSTIDTGGAAWSCGGDRENPPLNLEARAAEDDATTAQCARGLKGAGSVGLLPEVCKTVCGHLQAYL